MKQSGRKPMLLSRSYSQSYPNDSVCAKINGDISDVRKIVSVVHERDNIGNLIVTVYYVD